MNALEYMQLFIVWFGGGSGLGGCSYISWQNVSC